MLRYHFVYSLELVLIVNLVTDPVGLLNIEIDGTNFGVFDALNGNELMWFPRRADQLSAISRADSCNRTRP